MDSQIDASEDLSNAVTTEETRKFTRKQLEIKPSNERSSVGTVSQKTYLKAPSFALRKKDSGGKIIELMM